MILIYDTFFTLKFEKNIQISWPTLTEGLERPSGMKKIIAVLWAIYRRQERCEKEKEKKRKQDHQPTNKSAYTSLS